MQYELYITVQDGKKVFFFWISYSNIFFAKKYWIRHL
jgi:hypothetical protein